MKCDMDHDCQAAVTHVGNKGYIYCEDHAVRRRECGVERTRKLRAWEVALIAAGTPLPSYTPKRKRDYKASLTPFLGLA